MTTRAAPALQLNVLPRSPRCMIHTIQLILSTSHTLLTALTTFLQHCAVKKTQLECELLAASRAPLVAGSAGAATAALHAAARWRLHYRFSDISQIPLQAPKRRWAAPGSRALGVPCASPSLLPSSLKPTSRAHRAVDNGVAVVGTARAAGPFLFPPLQRRSHGYQGRGPRRGRQLLRQDVRNRHWCSARRCRRRAAAAAAAVARSTCKPLSAKCSSAALRLLQQE